jgi:tetratricopeptide (TPR) repeat protein
MYIVDPIWDPQTGVCTSKGKGLYDEGVEYFEEEEYELAKGAFLELIQTYPDDPFAIPALHELFALEQFLSEDYADLRNYYAAFTPADSALFDVADFLATRCNVVDRNWQPAIDWYENRIENPPSYPDSVFAVIDLGDIHLMMEQDTSSLKTARVFRHPEIIPESRGKYEENKAELLATLPKTDQAKPQHPLAETGKKGVLGQNIPNPAKGNTTIVYDVIEEGAVELKVYNQLGQLLQSLPQGTKKEGSYRIELSLAALPTGMYYYALFIDGEKADGKKLIKN